MSWKVIKKLKEKPKNSVLIVGLPGIGNVGKICVDFMIDALKAKKMFDFFSNSFPNSVFVNEKNLIELPLISLYYKKRQNKKDILLLTGDIQPPDEKSCYDFCGIINHLAKDLDIKQIVTLGGIGLKEEPTEPKLFATGNNLKLISSFCKTHKVSKDVYGTVGPIIGVSGVLPAVTKIPSLIFLAETFGHPFYVGLAGSKSLLEVLNTEFKINIKISKLMKEIKSIEEASLEKTKKLKNVADNKATDNYIG